MSTRNNKSFWQRVASFYDFAMRGESEPYKELEGYIRPYIDKDKKVLELCCGTGELASHLSSFADYWEATDFSDNMIAKAKKRGLYSTHFSVRDAMALPYTQGSFDVVIIVNALHLFSQPEVVLSEIKRVMKEDGVLIAPTYVYEGGTQKFARSIMLNAAGFKVYSKWSAAEYADFITKNGFSVKEQHLIEGKNLPICFISANRTKEGGN